MGRKQNDNSKAARERQIYAEFAGVAGLAVDPASIESDTPPNADIRCMINGKALFCEMAEIADQPVARGVAESIKTGEVTGGAFSQEEPLKKAFEDKSLISYALKGAELHLLAYYDKQYPLDYDPTFIPDTVGSIADQMIASGQWQQIWVYDTWEKRILWTHPPRPA